MVFSSAVFLFVFLPAVFVLDRLMRGVRLKNALLLAASLIFYAFGQPVYLPLQMCISDRIWFSGIDIGDAS